MTEEIDMFYTYHEDEFRGTLNMIMNEKHRIIGIWTVEGAYATMYIIQWEISRLVRDVGGRQ